MPDELRALGYLVNQVGKTERIVPNGITVEIAAERSSMPPLREAHAGIVQTDIYELMLPAAARA